MTGLNTGSDGRNTKNTISTVLYMYNVEIQTLQIYVHIDSKYNHSIKSKSVYYLVYDSATVLILMEWQLV